MQGEQQPQQTTTLAQKMEFTASLALFPAMTVMVFLYRKLGYRFLSPVKLLIMAILLIAVGAVSGMQLPFTIFALVMLILGLIERRYRWTDLTMGIPWHTYSRGVPLLSFIPIRESWIRRFVNPAIVAIAGIIILLFFRWLGLYIVLSAVCLLIFEGYDYDRNLNRQLDMMDRLVESEFVNEDTTFFMDGSQPRERPVEETAGIPTGVSPDLAAAIARRQAGRRQVPPPQAPTGPLGAKPPGNLVY